MSRFEIVRTDAGWHARFRAANHKVVWVTENYKQRKSAIKAILSIALEFDYAASPYVRADGRLYTSHGWHGQTIEVRDVDERTEGPPPLNNRQLLGAWALRQRAIRAFIDDDKKIHAIRELRIMTGAGLIESKEAIEVAQSIRGSS